MRLGTAAATAMAGGLAVTGTGTADYNGYDHKLRVEAEDGGDGEFWCYMYWDNGPYDYETENVEYDDFHEGYDNLLKLELLVEDSFWAPGYDIVRWNNGYEMWIQKYDKSEVDAYLDGQKIYADEGDTIDV